MLVFATRVCRDRGPNPSLPHARRPLYFYPTVVKSGMVELKKNTKVIILIKKGKKKKQEQRVSSTSNLQLPCLQTENYED